MEEVITRDYIKDEAPDVIIKIVDIAKLERNLYLTSQVLEMNVPTVIALKMMNMIENENTKIDIKACEVKDDDDSESIITSERYKNIQKDMKGIVKKSSTKKLTLSDKIDRVITNRFLAIPIFLAIIWFIYYVSISTLGDYCIGFIEKSFEKIGEFLTTKLPELGASEVVTSLVNDGIVQPIGSIFTFVPQLMLLFFFLSLLEDSGYMARVAFIMDKLFRKFGLSGKSFIPMLIGTGCSIPGVMATRTIEPDADRRMIILLTPFIPCGAKLQIFAMFISLILNDASWTAPLIYLISIVVVIIAGIILKRTNSLRATLLLLL